MEKFTVLRGIAAPLMRPHIDTGTIIPTDWLRSTSFDLGEKAFYNWRYDLDGKENGDFVLNRPRFRKSQILVAGPNFGCGSSREGAVWALMRFGIRCVIAASFGEIFYDNALQNGLLPVVVGEDAAARLGEVLERAETPVVTVDLVRCVVEAPDGATLSFSLPPDRRTALLEGLGETELILRYDSDIAAFQEKDATLRPWIYSRPA